MEGEELEEGIWLAKAARDRAACQVWMLAL